MIQQNRNFILVCALFCAPFFLGSCDLAAIGALQATSSPVSIRVTDPSGTGVSHAAIRLAPSPDPAPAKMETQQTGQPALHLKAAGYDLSVGAPGLKSAPTHIDVQGSKEVQVAPVRLETGALGSSMVTGDEVTPMGELRVSAYTKPEILKLKVADLKAMPRTTVTVHNEHLKAEETYAGVRLADVLGKLGAPLGHDLRGVALSGYVVATGSDGYVAVIALAEADPTFHSGEVIVADTMNGQPLDAKSGPFKLVVTEDKRPARWVRNLVSLELKSAK